MSTLRVNSLTNAAGTSIPGQGVYSMVRLNTHNGYGSTNTAIARFTNTVTNQGPDITYADSAANGASFTINASGIYSVNSCWSSTGGTYRGITKNSTQLTTGITGVTASDVLIQSTINAANSALANSWTGYLAAGDVVRVHGDATATGSIVAQFTITRVA